MELDSREKLIIHMEGLQVTLKKRNERIAELEAEIVAGAKSRKAQAEIRKAYKDGWQECANYMMGWSADAARALGKIRHDAHALYLQGEKAEYNKP